jgi:hypothetical protein
MPTIKMTLAEALAKAKPFTAEQKARFAAMGADDSLIDFSDQEEITQGRIDAGIHRVVSRGGVRVGAGRKPTGKLTKQVRLSPATIRKLKALQKRKGLPSFSAAVEAAAQAA